MIDEDINHPDRVVFIDPIFKTFREQRALTTLNAFDKTAHVIPSNQLKGFIHLFGVFTQLGDRAGFGLSF